MMAKECLSDSELQEFEQQAYLLGMDVHYVYNDDLEKALVYAFVDKPWSTTLCCRDEDVRQLMDICNGVDTILDDPCVFIKKDDEDYLMLLGVYISYDIGRKKAKEEEKSNDG